MAKEWQDTFVQRQRIRRLAVHLPARRDWESKRLQNSGGILIPAKELKEHIRTRLNQLPPLRLLNAVKSPVAAIVTPSVIIMRSTTSVTAQTESPQVSLTCDTTKQSVRTPGGVHPCCLDLSGLEINVPLYVIGNCEIQSQSSRAAVRRTMSVSAPLFRGPVGSL